MSSPGRRRWVAGWAAGLWLLDPTAWAGLQVYLLEPSRGDTAHEMVLVEKESAKDGTVVLLEPGGAEKKVARDRILARLTPAPGKGQKVDRSTAVAAINALLEAKGKAAALEKTIQEELEKWKRVLDQMPAEEDPQAKAKTEAEFSEAMAKAVPKPYDPSAAYTEEEVRNRLLALEQAGKDFPSKLEEVRRQAEPWRLEQQARDAGKKKLEGRWLTPEAWDQERGARVRAAREAFLAKLEIPEVPPVLLGQGMVFLAAGVVLGAVFFGASFLFHGALEFIRHRAWWKGTAWSLAGAMMVVLVVRAVGLGLGVPENLETGEGGRAEAVEEIFWEYGGEKREFPKELRIAGEDINAWLGKRLRFAPLKVTDIAVLAAEGWKLEMREGCVRLDRTGRFLGRQFLLRHEMTFSRSEHGEDVYRIEATLGRLPLPPALVLRSWNQWTETLARMTASIGAAERLTLERIEKGAVVFSGK